MGNIHSFLTRCQFPKTPSSFQFESPLFPPPSQDVPSAVFAPLHYEPGYHYPVVVWLHGHGADERELTRVMPLVSIRNYVAVAPRGILVEDPSGREVYGWGQSESAVQQAEQRIFESIGAVAQRFRFHQRRVFLVGYDAGGTMAFRLAADYPHCFAGVVSLGGRFPVERTPLGNLNRLRQLPIFLAVEHDSRLYPPRLACDDLRLFHAAGLSVTLRQYGRAVAPNMLADVDRWIMEQISPGGSSTVAWCREWSAGGD
jgi:phospholipase/carboxylesterase